ncbi:MAG: hypothetical protein MI743_00670 [Sneathiellales bacterium]|nr:hypothetical protein [Sneathiellales bacterium]
MVILRHLNPESLAQLVVQSSEERMQVKCGQSKNTLLDLILGISNEPLPKESRYSLEKTK